MNNKTQKNCNNCGAQVFTQAGNKIKCDYCGSILEDNNLEVSAKPQNALGNSTPSIKPPTVQETKPDSGTGIIIVAFIIILIFAIVMGVNNRSHSNQSSYSDTLLADSINSPDKPNTTKNSADETPTYVKTALEEMKPVQVNVSVFKKLYRNAWKKKDPFSGSTVVYDKSSPRYVNYNGVFAYINMESTGMELRFCIQYTADEWLFIKNMTFNAGGENFYYAPVFKTDNGAGAIWEWSDDAVSDADLPMLIKIATSKKAKVKYEGDKYFKVVNISKAQQLALKKQLQIYKGLLLKYDK
ncbi:hypothetical protein DYU05_02970 [Mucilaginibacter terrenus]|uniref:Uncharacterized protein n=1 Tax=Mucilaginibacter terrenus TaxID=2482727 RepID=A0A3E2NUA5_9SPHI|nr:hypothetical protein [Mucilaginibacter terrenus]RFZ84593.1 hypothetical protein DYU05_02970 [Mucilaginibacter terrenus]